MELIDEYPTGIKEREVSYRFKVHSRGSDTR
jgi:hypothetical protein